MATVARSIIWKGIAYGIALGLLSVGMYWAKYRFVIMDHAFEIYAGLIAILFVSVGAWLGNRLTKPERVVEQQIVIREVVVPAQVNTDAPLTGGDAAGISPRELEVLQLLARGLSNVEIGAQLFVSLNTVKTHLSSLYFKLDVKRRTQAVERARALGLIR